LTEHARDESVSDAVSDLLPVLVADLVDESARDFLESVARENEEAWVPLVAAPALASPHLLEVYTPSREDPLRLIAEPTGPPSEHGFPLRLSFPDGDERAGSVPRVETVDALPDVVVDGAIEPALPGVVARAASERREGPRVTFARSDTPTIPRTPGAPRKPTPIALSEEHTAELSREAIARPAADPRDALVGRALAGGKLEIESLIGKGMMGAVYRARHRELRKPVAVKVMHDVYQRDVDFCRRFYAEALVASRLDHPNLVRVYDFGQEADGLLYLAMEFLAGRSLRDAAWQERPLPTKRIAEIMMQVCAGLGQAHARGIVHRDVKPDNVVLVATEDDDGQLTEQVKVCDFGLALTPTNDSSGAGERFAGTPVYMSPEQCRGEELDLRTDVYACGIVLFELATGTVPFLSDKPIVVVNRHLAMPPPSITELRPDIDPRLDRIVQKALKKPREERYQSMRELRADLKELLSPPEPAFDLASEARRISSRPPPSLVPPAPPSLAPPPPSAPAPSVPAPAPSSSGSMSVPPPPPSSSPMRRAAPAWLEDKQDAYSQFLHGMGEKRSEQASDALARDSKAWLARLVEEREGKSFELRLDELESAIPLLAKKADARTLRAASSTLHALATDETRAPSVRARATSMLRAFADPGQLAPIAERLLARNDDQREAARTLVLQAGVAGAYALYGARVKLAADPAVRRPFIETMRGLGEAAWPVVRAALEKIPETALTGAHPAAATLAEDLLLCVPALRDEAAGHLVAKYVRARQATLCRAATQALGRLWAERAAPLLLGLLADPDDGVRIAAIAGLRQIGAVDEHVVRRLAPILAGKVAAGPQLRLATVQSLEFVTPDARPVAVPLLVQIVRGEGIEDAIVLAASKALLSIMGNEARAVVIERSDRASEALKAHLLPLLADPKLPGDDIPSLD